MSRKICEREELKWWSDFFTRRNIKVDVCDFGPIVDEIIEHVVPAVIRSSDERMEAAYEKMLEAIKILEDGTPVNIQRAMRAGELDPHNRSDVARTRIFLQECGLLTHKKGEPEQWIKRITNELDKWKKMLISTSS